MSISKVMDAEQRAEAAEARNANLHAEVRNLREALEHMLATYSGPYPRIDALARAALAAAPAVCRGTGTVPTDFQLVVSAIPTTGQCGICGRRAPIQKGPEGVLAAHPRAAPEPQAAEKCIVKGCPNLAIGRIVEGRPVCHPHSYDPAVNSGMKAAAPAEVGK